MKPANDVGLDIKHVHIYTTILSMPLKPYVRQKAIHRWSKLKCANCGMPVLEHEYDSSRDVVLHWAGNCAIVKTRKEKKRETLRIVSST